MLSTIYQRDPGKVKQSPLLDPVSIQTWEIENSSKLIRNAVKWKGTGKLLTGTHHIRLNLKSKCFELFVLHIICFFCCASIYCYSLDLYQGYTEYRRPHQTALWASTTAVFVPLQHIEIKSLCFCNIKIL